MQILNNNGIFILFFQVSDNTTILDVKKKITKLLHIPMAHQKLLYLGRTLIDEKTIGNYCTTIRPRAKLTLVVKEPETLKVAIYKLFRKYYEDDESQAMAIEFINDFNKRLHLLSLDDFEVLAKYFLEKANKISDPLTFASSSTSASN